MLKKFFPIFLFMGYFESNSHRIVHIHILNSLSSFFVKIELSPGCGFYINSAKWGLIKCRAKKWVPKKDGDQKPENYDKKVVKAAVRKILHEVLGNDLLVNMSAGGNVKKTEFIGIPIEIKDAIECEFFIRTIKINYNFK